MCEVMFDENGKATILRSFAKPSKGSTTKQGKKVAKPKEQAKQVEDADLFWGEIWEIQKE